MATATTVEIFTADQWAQRLLRLYPNNWTGDAAKMAGGILYSLFNAPSSQYNFLQNGLDWLLNACRIATATDTALDAIANDYFGNVAPFEAVVVRQPGEPDSTFRQRIYDNLIQGGGTRADINRVVELLTGQAPRIIEPWNILDCGACDAVSFVDIDTPANPCRVGELVGSFHHQGIVESILPPYSGGNNPVYCVDDGISCDRSFVLDPQPTWFLGEQELDLALNRVRMFATIIWRRYGFPVIANYARGNSSFPSSGVFTTAINLSPPSPQPLVVLASAGWNSSVGAYATDNGNFVITTAVPAPGGEVLDWVAAPSTLAGFGRLSMTAGAFTASIAVPIANDYLFITPSWPSNFWLTTQESTTASFIFDTPAPAGGYLNYGCFGYPNIGTKSVPSGQSAVMTVTFNVPISNPYQLMVLPAWDTQYFIVKSSTGFTVQFTTIPTANTFFNWGVLNQPY